MPVTATLSNYRQAPRKVRLVATLIQGKSVTHALAELKVLGKRAAPIMEKLVRSAVANAKAQGMNETDLVVKSMRVDKGTVMKRFMPRAMGRAFPINKRSSHIRVELDVKGVKDASTAKKSTKKAAATDTTTETVAAAPKKRATKKTSVTTK